MKVMIAIMKNVLHVGIFPLFVLMACSDGVPKVSNYHDIVIDGKKTTQADFLQKYCVGKTKSETCDRVQNAMTKDATKGTVPRF
jgi:hypothetical protein